MLEFRALGPITVVSDGTPIELPRGKDRVLLAVLVLLAPRPASIDELIDALWSGCAPATAPEMIRNSVARLRTRVGHGVFETTPAGYRLAAAADAIDLHRFEDLATKGTRALEAGDPQRAAAELREALALWRGRPLPELDESHAYAPQLLALEELRLRVEEDRIEAELTLGHAAPLVPALEALHQEHPYRERLLGQLMLALYRAGRQKDALDRYVSARRRLVNEAGLEPAPELQDLQQRILRQDPTLADAPRPPSATTAPSTRRLPLMLAAAVLLAVAAALLVTTWPQAGPVQIPRRGIVALRAATGRPESATALHLTPGLLAVDATHVWVASSRGPEVLTLSSRQLIHPRTTRIPQTAFSLAATGGSLWVGNGFGGTISRIDAQGRIIRTFRPEPNAEGRSPITAARPGRLWVASQNGTLTSLDPKTGRRIRTYRRVGLSQSIAADGNTVWIADASSDAVERFDNRHGRVVRRIEVGGRPDALVIGNGSLWALTPVENMLFRIDPHRNAVVQPFSLPSGTTSLAATPGKIWVGTTNGLLIPIDTATNRMGTPQLLGRPIDALAGTHTILWAAVG